MNFKLNQVPEDKLFFELLDFMQVISDKFYLVVRMDVKYDNSSQFILNKLEPFKIKNIFSNEWPGTEILDKNKKAAINFYKTTEDTVELLKNNSNGLFLWKCPKYPDDLSFLRKDGSIILMNTSHEETLEIELNQDEIDILNHRFSDSLLRQVLIAIHEDNIKQDVPSPIKKWWMV